tara:strand:- start:451 stop:924 length:474 start_codon:yes stop_codon:yes gene_type:complete
MFKKWQKLIYEFHKRGGHLSYAVDDPFIWNTTGIGNVRELQLMKESGLHALEVIRSATRNSAITLRQPKLGLVQTGFVADLAIIDGNPLDNFHYMYAFGGIDFSDGVIKNKGGVRWTVKSGILFDNKMLIKEVLEEVKESKKNWINPVKKLYKPAFR